MRDGCLSACLCLSLCASLSSESYVLVKYMYCTQILHTSESLSTCGGVAWRVIFPLPGTGQSPVVPGLSGKLSPNQNPQTACFSRESRIVGQEIFNFHRTYHCVDACGSDGRPILWIIEACMCPEPWIPASLHGSVQMGDQRSLDLRCEAAFADLFYYLLMFFCSWPASS